MEFSIVQGVGRIMKISACLHGEATLAAGAG
jgi:hypothetical protein